MQKREEPRGTKAKHVVEQIRHEKPVTAQNLGSEYDNLTTCIYETIKEIVPEQKWIKKNGRVVSPETKQLFEKRAKEYRKNKPTKQERKKWNKKIRNACRKDYRSWVTKWVQKIEAADNKGDTKSIFCGVKALSGSKAAKCKQPTEYFETKEKNHEENADGKSKEESKTEEPDGNSKPPIRARKVRIGGPEELADVWHDFLDKKFSATERERLRAEFEALSECEDPNAMLTRKEFDDAVNGMKTGKAVGEDRIPAEVWQNSTVARNKLFEFLQKVWNKEEVPPNLVVCIFVMIYKQKGSHNDCSKYRAMAC